MQSQKTRENGIFSTFAKSKIPIDYEQFCMLNENLILSPIDKKINMYLRKKFGDITKNAVLFLNVKIKKKIF